MPESVFSVDFTVRDYEVDMQGIVNNAIYQHYLEHARHEYLKSIGLNFAEMTALGINLVVIRAELDYRRPLMSGNSFVVKLRCERESPLRVTFIQDICRTPDNMLMLTAKITGTALNKNGRPEKPALLDRLFGLHCMAPKASS